MLVESSFVSWSLGRLELWKGNVDGDWSRWGLFSVPKRWMFGFCYHTVRNRGSLV